MVVKGLSSYDFFVVFFNFRLKNSEKLKIFTDFYTSIMISKSLASF
jgi:hypothetical protein